MAPKRSAPPPPPPPPAASSSEETTSGSGSDESEEEEVVPASPTPTYKNPPPPPQKGEESETSDEEEEEEEESDEEPTHANPPSAPKNPPPPPRQVEESDTSGEDEEEEGESSESETDKAAPPKPAPNQEAEGKDLKPSPSGEAKKLTAPFHRTWSTDDEVRILEALAAHRREHGALPQHDALFALAGSLDNRDCGLKELQGKVQHLKRRYDTAARKGELPIKDHDRRLFNLSKSVWGGDKAADTATGAAMTNGRARRDFGEMCELYPYLAEEVKALEAAQPGLFKREFGRIDDDKALALDVKIKKQRLVQMKVELQRGDLTKEVTKALMELVE